MLRSNFEETVMVSWDAMKRANSTLEDFCRSYFMFHDLDVNCPKSLFGYLPVLSFTESYIYQLDSLNEKIMNMPAALVSLLENGPEENWSCFPQSVRAFRTCPFKPLVDLLECNGLLTDGIREELRRGEEYWALERNLCHSLMNNKEVSIEDVMRAIRQKSFDYRVNDMHMEFLSISEFLVEIADDFHIILNDRDADFYRFDYEDDVLENNFNILRMFVRIYGPSEAPIKLANCISEAEEQYSLLLKTLDPQLAKSYQKRCEEATKEGGKVSGHALGTWNIPAVVADEDFYRSNLLNSKIAEPVGD